LATPVAGKRPAGKDLYKPKYASFIARDVPAIQSISCASPESRVLQVVVIHLKTAEFLDGGVHCLAATQKKGVCWC